ncbi:hypothetical protein Tco_1577417 [Tanacetum coccineum]
MRLHVLKMSLEEQLSEVEKKINRQVEPYDGVLDTYRWFLWQDTPFRQGASEGSVAGLVSKSALLVDDYWGLFLFVSFLVYGATLSDGGVVFGVVAVPISVSITSGSVLAVVDSARLGGFAIWTAAGSGAVDGGFCKFCGCVAGRSGI